MATSNTFESTPLDDLKDLVWLTHDRLGVALDQLSGRGIDIETEEWAFEEIQRSAVEALAKHVPGMRYGSDGLALYDDAEACRAAHTYDDGTPIRETITFPDISGLSFTYRPRHDRPRDEFLKWAREEAEKFAEDQHARYVSAGDLGIEYIGGDEPVTVHLGDDAVRGLSVDQLFELRDGLSRIIQTATTPEPSNPISWPPAA